MRLFRSKISATEEQAVEKIASRVEARVQAIVGDELARLDNADSLEGKRRALEEEVNKLQAEATAKQITLDRVNEDHAREKREIEHKVGLHKKQVEHEIGAAKKETELLVKEENLNAEKERFEKEIAFMRERFETEVGYLREMMGEVLNRLPEVKVERTYKTEEHIGEKPKRKALDAAKGRVV